MSLLEKILYVADYIEPGRDFEGVEEVRALAWRDLDAALLLGLENTRREVLSEGGPLHGDTVAAIDDLKKKAISSATSQKE
jgi:nicotinate-nucleotide adenylyltransferase